MRKFTLVAVMLFCWLAGTQDLSAQNSGNRYGGYCPVPGDILSPCNNSNGLGNNPWPMNLVTDIMKEAKPTFDEALNLSLGQMLQAYHECRCTIQYQGNGYFRVSIGGINDIIAIDGF